MSKGPKVEAGKPGVDKSGDGKKKLKLGRETVKDMPLGKGRDVKGGGASTLYGTRQGG